jgi:hypothetical protein
MHAAARRDSVASAESESGMDADASLPEDGQFDRLLWVRDRSGHVGCLGSNGQTFVGRFLVWWPHHGMALSTSLHELSECSHEAALWLRGYLQGSSPEAWCDDEGFDYAVDDERTELWREAVAGYQLTGAWRPGRTCEVCGQEVLPSSPVGLRCAEHGGEIRSCWPKVIAEPEPA